METAPPAFFESGMDEESSRVLVVNVASDRVCKPFGPDANLKQVFKIEIPVKPDSVHGKRVS
jgi:hypothetical protein